MWSFTRVPPYLFSIAPSYVAFAFVAGSARVLTCLEFIRAVATRIHTARMARRTNIFAVHSHGTSRALPQLDRAQDRPRMI